MKASLTHFRYGDILLIPFTQVTVVFPARVNGYSSFALQLQGPFDLRVRAASQFSLLPVPPFSDVLVLFKAFIVLIIINSKY
jgi:hypothetical protein